MNSPDRMRMDGPDRLVRSARAYFDLIRGDRALPRRADVTFEHVHRAASRAMILRVGSGGTLADMSIVNAGSELEETLGRKLTGLTMAALADLLADDDRTTFCLSEYEQAARDAVVLAHLGHFATRDAARGPVRYERIILPLSEDGGRVDHLLVFVDFLSNPSPPHHHPPTEPA